MPAQHLGAKMLVLGPDDGYCYSEPNDDGVFRWQLTEDGAVYPDVEGTVVWTRPCMARAVHGVAMAATGRRVVCEVDDNYLSDPTQNIFMRTYNFNKLGRRSHMQAFASMDAIICSTAWLRDEYASTFKKELSYVPDMFVARNHIDRDAWRDRTPLLPASDGRVRVGWAGSHQHIWDLRLAAPALRLAQDMGCEVVLIGLDPAQHDPKWKDFLTYTHVPWSDHYHDHYINLDIGLAPLVYNKHTCGKSDIKWLEYTMSGVATVAQNMVVYQSITHGETGFLAGSPDEMAFYMAKLVESRKLREQMVAAAKEQVLAERTIQGNLREWEEAILG